MGILLDLVTKLKDFQENTNSLTTAEKPQEGSEFFLEINQSSTEEAKKEQVGEKFSSNFISLFMLILKWSFLCLDPSFRTWCNLQASMFGAVVSGPGVVCIATPHSEPCQIKAVMCSVEWGHFGLVKDQCSCSQWSVSPGPCL